MADIEIQKKRRPLWPWVVAVLLFVAAFWLITGLLATREQRVPGQPAPLAQPPVQPATQPPAQTPAGPVPPAPVPESK